MRANAGERRGDGDADEQRGAPAQHHEHDHHDQQDRGDDAVLQLQHGAIFGLVWVKVTATVLGQVFFRSSMTLRVASTVSMRLAPVRFETSMVMAGLPLMRVIGRVLEGRANLGDIAGDGSRARDGNRIVENIVGGLVRPAP